MDGVHQFYIRTGVYKLSDKGLLINFIHGKFLSEAAGRLYFNHTAQNFYNKVSFFIRFKMVGSAFFSNDSQIRVLPCISFMAQGA